MFEQNIRWKPLTNIKWNDCLLVAFLFQKKSEDAYYSALIWLPPSVDCLFLRYSNIIDILLQGLYICSKRRKKTRRGSKEKTEELCISDQEGEEYMSEGEDGRLCIKWRRK